MFTIKPQQEVVPVVLTVKEACAALHVSPWTLYKLIRERKLDSIKIGRRRLIPVGEIPALIERLRTEGTW